MPDHLVALQHMVTSDFALGLQSAASEWCEPCDARAMRCRTFPKVVRLRNLRRAWRNLLLVVLLTSLYFLLH
jgi:hypothetical protein